MKQYPKMAHVESQTPGKRHVWVKVILKDRSGKEVITKIRKQIEKIPNDVPWAFGRTP